MTSVLVSLLYLVQIIIYLIIARTIASWFFRSDGNFLYRTLIQLTEPFLAPFRYLAQRIGIDTGMVDFSPLLSVIALQLLQQLIHSLILGGLF